MKKLLLICYLFTLSLNADCIAENTLARETGMKAVGLLKYGEDGCGYAKLSRIHTINGITMCENDIKCIYRSIRTAMPEFNRTLLQ
jgi:hypothetical protein